MAFGEIALNLVTKSVTWIFIGVIILVVLVGLGFFLWWWWRRKKWNMKVVIKLPRANGLIISEIGKGHYDVKSGIVDIKRRGLKPVGMKPFDVRKYLQGDVLEVVMLSPNDIVPIVPESYQKVFENGVEHIVVKVETDLLKRRTWKNYFERESKNRFTILGFLDKHWQAISLGIVMFAMFIGFAVLWSKITPPA